MISVEALMLAPVLLWAFVATYTYFDAYRQNATNLKAAYTIGDLISRETETIDSTYINSMHTLLTHMVRSGSDVDLRITVIRFDEDDARYYVDWSTTRGFTEEIDDGNLADMKERLPTMPDQERVILVETRNRYVPPFNIGLDVMDMDNFVFTRPRFTDQVPANV